MGVPRRPCGDAPHPAGITPSCCSRPNVSSSCQYSAMRPSAIRQMSIPETVTTLFVAGLCVLIAAGALAGAIVLGILAAAS